MSLAIDIDKVYEVLLPDGWHKVANNSFYLDAYEYIHQHPTRGSQLDFGGGEGKGAPSTGFGFTEVLGGVGDMPLETTIEGPVSSILAVRERSEQ
jgi:hypothetical protein